MKKYWQKFVIISFRFLLRVLKHTPWKPALAWANAMGFLGYRLSKRYRNVADKNLRLAYGDTMSESQRHVLIKKVFQHFCRATLVEFLKAQYMSPDQVRKMVTLGDLSIVEDALSRGKGLLAVSAHFGNWELMARRLALEGYRFAVVARQSPDPAFNEITDTIRQNGGYEVYPRGNSAKLVLQRLRKGGIIAILPDQKSEDVFVPFFGHWTGTVAGPAVLALKTGAPIVMMFCIRQPDGTYHTEILPEIDITSTGNVEQDSNRIMTDINATIEMMVRRYPDQWLWLHDRWKSPVPEHLQDTECSKQDVVTRTQDAD